ncbi:Tail sheath protein, subtilisin-like domain containing protein [uncultured Caudovirales phage]|uniref:Tail sheath protein, subtilisin-like domain containing protein n=1 Tax=uncultured Caudovirales phage TaxID=2100421 RepID=A0A6J5SQQ2_9CAUD|nr:Tail sheath protein, subtilisin-like domain containing protein [uncultured Caudovirales phage]CAB4193240.1 Tail sheath protein, subtilisin-like domain containing protein [uncultured Caudovirales phage]CAB4217852.1 Tail sheath protein, subtilisin-like domain containing protein [uncultured Caudovirales phage]CAB5231664.1 Tail sheath protein, subtilisin-like domain containing protein [uncultured Caudovirales phage]
MALNGLAKTEINIQDLSVIISGGLSGVIGVLGVTERGIVGKPVLIGSWLDFTREFGGLLTTSDFPLLCRRTLESGGLLKVCRAGHYTNLADKNTLTGVKASVSITQSSVSATAATDTLTVTVPGATGEIVTVQVNEAGAGIVSLGTYTVIAADTATLVATGLRAAINANTGTTGYSAAGSGVAVIVSAPAADGAAANAYTPLLSAPTAAGTWGTATFAGGVSALTAHTFVATAKAVGPGYNGTILKITAPTNGTGVDLEVSLPGYPDLTETTKNFPTVPLTNDLNLFNQRSKLIDLSGFTGTLCPRPLVTLISGVQNVAEITTVDYIGDVAGQTGIRAFDGSPDITKIAVPEKAINALDVALANYAVSRGDVIAVLRTPVGLDGLGVQDYREATGAYSGTAVDTWQACMTTGGLTVLHPTNLVKQDIPEIADVLAAFSKKDNTSPVWFSAAGPKRGRIKNALGVVYDFGSAARQLQADNIANRGVNPVIKHNDFGVVFWGNRTMQKANTMLSYLNVAELFIFLKRNIKPLVESEAFDPNDIETWKAIYRKVYVLLELMNDNRAFQSSKTQKGYLYQGDQDIDDVSQATINTPNDIDAGIYRFRLFIKPVNATQFFGITATITNSGVDFAELLDIPLV